MNLSSLLAHTGLPSWLLFAFAASVCSALGLYMHQRLKPAGAVSAIWVKIIGVCVAAPVLARTGLPAQPMFYVYTAAAAMLWCVNDLVYFRAIQKHGAALISRLTPLGLVLIFVLWFTIKPELLGAYLKDMPRFIAICATLLFAVFCAFEAKRCHYSAAALRSIWFVLFASVAGTFLVKLAIDIAPDKKGVFGYVGIEAALMLCFYTVWFSLRDPSTARVVLGRRGIMCGLAVGGLIVAGIVLRTFAQQRVDHPAYVGAIGMLEVVWLMALTRLSGWKDGSNKLAGLGIVASALVLAFLKIR